MGRDIIDILTAIGLDTKDPGELSWALVYNAMTSAVVGLLRDSEVSQEIVDSALKQLPTILDTELSNQDLQITESFFECPKRFPIVIIVQSLLQQWLKEAGIDPLQSKSLSHRLPTYFVFELTKEWKERRQDYAYIREYVETPFSTLAIREDSWRLYDAWLKQQIESPMMLEPFGLRDVYIPLRGYYDHTFREGSCVSENADFEGDYISRASENKRVVVDLATCLDQWIEEADIDDAIRVISGGPGSGKSSFAKFFAARHTDHHPFPVLFIPIHQINLDFITDFRLAVGDFIKYTHIKENPLNPQDQSLRLLIILDGLDELALQSGLARENSHAFVRAVESEVNAFNRIRTRLQVIITGREIAIQASCLQDTRSLLHMLPYLINPKELEPSSERAYIDTHRLLYRDQRIDWWNQYERVTQKSYKRLREQIQSDALEEITAQPLLNYLVAMSYDTGSIVYSEDTQLNEIYQLLVEEVHKRGYEGHRNTTVSHMTQAEFVRILEEVALSAWHGHGRTTTVREIEQHCDNSRLKHLLDKFQEGAEEGITKLLTAFYFRQNGSRSDEKTFEFTHKSFGEYLAARRIVRAIGKIQKELDARSQDMEDGWDEKEALAYWATICGPTTMDVYLLSFLKNEVSLRPIKQVRQWQLTLSHLISFMRRQGMPMERVDLGMRFGMKDRRAVNSEEALLAALNVCALKTQQRSNIEWRNGQDFSTWINRLLGERSVERETTVTMQSLSWLNLSDSVLDFQDFQGANLECSDLSCASLRGTNLRAAKLMNAVLTQACLERAVLDKTHLDNALLDDASLESASIDSTILRGANLNCAILDNASAKSAVLDGATLNGASLHNVKFVKVSLRKAQLESADMSEAYLEDADFSGANLDGANLDGAFVEGAIFSEAALHGARLGGTSGSRTIWTGAELDEAMLDGAMLDGAIFSGAVLDGAVLDHASLNGTRLVGARLRGTSLLDTTFAHANFDLADLGDITWNANTQLAYVSGMETAVNVPTLLRRQMQHGDRGFT